MPYVILGFFDLFEVLAIGHYWFGVPIRSNLLLVAGTRTVPRTGAAGASNAGVRGEAPA
jgi:hypothetical protein